MIEIREIVWAAGFLEGEGCFHARNRAISCSQVQRWPLDRLAAAFGGHIGFRTPQNENHSPYYAWTLCGSAAAGLMMTLYGLMSPRRQWQIRAALAMRAAGPGSGSNRKGITHCKAGHPLSEARVYRGRRCCRACEKSRVRKILG